ncbi:MAG TPA: thioredoxin, partial [Clostridiales bacterium]|nr:thioredoxin [Clostridiales bacterium]
VDECPNLAMRFGIMSIPTLIVFKDGEKKEVLVGYRLKMQIAEVLDKYL